MRNRYALQSVIAAVGLFAALPTAWAAPAGPVTPVRGQVTAVDTTAKTITLEDRRSQSTSTLHVNDATKYLVDAVGTMSDIKVGQTVRVLGQTAGTTVTARMIQIVPTEEANQAPPQFGGRGGGRFSAVQGVVATVAPTLTITTADKQTDTVQTDPNTRVTTSHAGTLADVKPQEFVNAVTNGTGASAMATSVHVRQGGGFGGGRGGRRRGGGAAPVQ
jgi:hypothetical protein